LLLTGSAGGGKSRLAAEKLHGYLLRYPNAMGLAVRKTRNSMTNSTVLFLERTVIGDDPQVTHYPSKNRFEYANGSILAYGGMANEEQREQIRSIGSGGSVDMAWMEEATRFTEDDYNEIMPRMRGTAANWRQVILTTNPDTPSHWIHRRLIEGGEARVYLSGAPDNPYNPEDYLVALDRLTGPLRDRLRDGRWVQAEGAVYPEWDATVHLIDPFPVPAEWRRFRSIDFGYTNPFVCQWWAMDGDGRMYLYREIYYTQRLVEDHAGQIVALSRGEAIEASVADHDAEDRATLERYGVYTQPAIKDVSPGIQAVQARLRRAGDGKPRLYIMRDALVDTDPALLAAKKPTCTEEETSGYVWQRTADGRATKEEPLKIDDHGMDAMRYAVMYADNGGTWWIF
jgi:phage terminase large subunit